MISVIICSVSPSFLKQVQNNIRKTIGVEYEVLFYNNAIDPRGICEVYNLLAEKAKYPFLCFVHEDVLFNTANWGQVIIDLFKGPEVGVIGVAGSKYKSKYYSGWYTGVKEFDCANIIHRLNDEDKRICLSPTNEIKLQDDVVCIDGVFMCAKKQVWEKIKFNQEGLKGFHYYDIDFSIRAARFCEVLVSYQIEIVHLTVGGDFGENWINTTFLFHDKLCRDLPFTHMNVIPKDGDRKIIITLLDVLKNYNISWSNKYKWIISQKFLGKPEYYYPIIKFLFYRPFGLKFLHNLFRSKRI